MARAKTLNLEDSMTPDALACDLANRYLLWENYRVNKLQEWKEVQSYVFATDTTKTTNSKLPWNNKTTIPKLCQIRDNLHANYMAALFPKRKWMQWIGSTREDEARERKDAIEGYMIWAMESSGFYKEMNKVVLDYIDYGNCFIMPYWKDERIVKPDGGETIGYVGPAVKRISPADIVFDPTAMSFVQSPKIIRSFVSLGEVKNMMAELSNTPDEEARLKELWSYMHDLRKAVHSYTGSVSTKDNIFEVAGFNNYRDYLVGDHVEVLTFYGDLYDRDSDTLLQNHVIKVIDRHKILCKMPNETVFGYAPIYHAGWRVRPDNLWAMGPLDNLVGMQYRIDHLENLKSDIFDLTAFPVFKIKGYVEPFEWKPMEKIIITDDGDVSLLSPEVNALQFDSQVQILEQKMEEMAGAPKEAMGFRTPGEKTKYEVQRLEIAGGRIFQAKAAQFEMEIVEPVANGMLELARRNLDKVTIRSFDSELKIAIFNEMSVEDITGNGSLKPFAARHFAEQANMVQNLNAFFSSSIGADEDIKVHFSAERLARVVEELLELTEYRVVEPYVRISERADAQRMMQNQQEQMMMEQNTSSGIGNDFDPEVLDEPIEEQVSESQTSASPMAG